MGSVKGAVVRDVGPFVPAGVHFIPAHPIAGTEFSGPEAGFAGLFDGRWAILTPVAGSDPKAVQKLKDFWLALGSQVDVMDSAHHDLVLAITSHLEHEGSGYAVLNAKISSDGKAVADATLTLRVLDFPNAEMAEQMRKQADTIGLKIEARANG